MVLWSCGPFLLPYWFQNREHLGMKTYWPTVAYIQFAALDLLQTVQATLAQYRRWTL